MSLTFSRPADLEHGQKFSALTVLEKLPCGRYRVGCKCGRSDRSFRAKALMSGRVKDCGKCAARCK